MRENLDAMARRAGPDPVDWIYQSWAYDAHNVETTPGHGGDTAAALRAIRAPTLLLVPELDSLIAVEVNAQFRVIIFGELKPERLDSLPV